MDIKEVELGTIELFSLKSPGGTKTAGETCDRLEEMFNSEAGRNWYSLIYERPGEELEYWSGLEQKPGEEAPHPEIEAKQIVAGKYVSTILENWPENIPQFGKKYDKMEETYEVDNSRPSIEHYLPGNNCDLLMPVKHFKRK